MTALVRRSARWAVWVAAFVLIVLIGAQQGARPSAHVPGHGQSQNPPGGVPTLGVMDALELYALGDPEVIKMVATPRWIGSIQEALVKDGSAWIRANGPSETSHRRMVAATFALEAMRHVFESNEGVAFEGLLRWASGELQLETKATDGERLWRRSAIALLQGGVSLQGVDRELNVARGRFPSEPRWILIRAWHTELDGTFYPTRIRSAPLDGIVDAPPSVIRAYEDALKVPAIRAEAATRLAYLRCAAGKIDFAIDLAAEGARSTEPEIRSLAHLIGGWAHMRGGRPAEALAEFQAAHDALPASQSAALWLARALFLDGRRADAQSIVDETQRTGLGEMDPFRLYPRGDFRLWPSLIAQLREAIR